MKVINKKELFSFENLEVYQRGINFANKIFSLTNSFPQTIQYSLGDQLRRAALSIVNNIAEGSDRVSAKEKRKFYEYSLCSARECIPMITITNNQKLIDSLLLEKLREKCIIICKMLRKLINSVH